jgi:hypothetical protein
VIEGESDRRLSSGLICLLLRQEFILQLCALLKIFQGLKKQNGYQTDDTKNGTE